MRILLFKLSGIIIFYWIIRTLIFLIIVMIVIEASLGISLVVSSSRSTGELNINI